MILAVPFPSMNNISPVWLIVIAVISSSVATSFVNHILIRKREKAETKKTEADAKKAEIDVQTAEIDLEEKLSNYYKQQFEQVFTQLKLLRSEVKGLKNIVQRKNAVIKDIDEKLKEKDLNDCRNYDCPNRNSKKQQLKPKVNEPN